MMTVFQTPAAPTNYGGYGRFNAPRALVFHTPEEKPDAYESTPVWFANPAALASTQAYISDNGDLYECVPDEQPAWACGTHSDIFDAAGNLVSASNRHWKGNYKAYAPWGEPGVSNNCLTLNVEIEGYAATLDMPEAQYQTMLAWAREKIAKYNIPVDYDHLVGHGDLATDRVDPGPNFPWVRLMADLSGIPVADQPAPVPATPADGGFKEVTQAELVEVLNDAAAGSLGAALGGTGGVKYLVQRNPDGKTWDFRIHAIPLAAAPDLDALK